MSDSPAGGPSAAGLTRILRRTDALLFSVCAIVGLDQLGIVSSFGLQTMTWLVLLGILFLFPYALVMAELGSTFTHEGGAYVWMKLAFGRLYGAVGTLLYWVTTPLWLGGSLCFVASAAVGGQLLSYEFGSVADYVFKIAFIAFTVAVAIVSLRYGKWVPRVGAVLRVAVLAVFSLTILVYAVQHGVHGVGGARDLVPTLSVFIALAPLIVFSYEGLELASAAGDEIEEPGRSVPWAVIRATITSALCYAVPILGILVVLPASEVSGISGFLDAVKETFRGVYGGAATVLIDLMTVSFVVALLTQGCTWLMGTDRMMAAAAADGAYPRYLGRFDPRLRTPVRVNVLSGIVALAFMFAAQRLSTGSAGATFKVVLSISISTLVIALTMLFPAAIKLRRSAAEVERPFRVPGGERGIWLAAGLCAFWCAFSSLETVFPGTVERLFGEGYSFEESWGMSQLRFEAFTLGTLAVLTAIGVGGYLWAQREQRGEPAAGPPGVDPIQAVALPQQASE